MAQSKYALLYGVGRVTAYDLATNEVIFTSKTLQDQGFSFTVTAEEIRGGDSNKLLGRYFHDSGMTLTLNDAQFAMEYIALQLGADIVRNQQTVLTTIQRTAATGGTIDVTDLAVGPFAPGITTSTVVWYRQKTEPFDQVKVFPWAIDPENPTAPIVIDGLVAGIDYCLSYYDSATPNRSLTVSSTFVPAIVGMTLVYFQYVGSGEITSHSKIGELQIKIPKFQFDGTMDFTLSASGTSPVPITGQALAVDSSDCFTDSGIYAEVVEVRYNAAWYEGIEALELDGGDVITAANPLVINIPAGGDTISVADVLTLLEAAPYSLSGDVRAIWDDGNSSVIKLVDKNGIPTLKFVSATASGTEVIPTVNADGSLSLTPPQGAAETGQLIIGINGASADYQNILLTIDVAFPIPTP